MSTQGYSSYPNGFTIGMTLKNLPIQASYPGQIFWVNNSTVPPVGGIAGSNGNPGTYSKPFATLLYAQTKCVANRGDVILVGPGHAETIADATTLTLNKAGTAIIGLGNGSLRPTLTFSTATTANIPITARNMAIKNILFVMNKADIASVFTATGTATPTDFIVENCEFRDSTSILNALTIITGNATAGSMSGLYFAGNRISSLGTTAATTSIILAAAADRVTIKNNFGNWAVLNNTAGMLATGANSVTNFEFSSNVLNRPNTATTSGLMISTSGTAWTGQCSNNMIWGLNNSAQIWIDTGTKLAFNQNFCPITAVADKSGLINPAAV